MLIPGVFGKVTLTRAVPLTTVPVNGVPPTTIVTVPLVTLSPFEYLTVTLTVTFWPTLPLIDPALTTILGRLFRGVALTVILVALFTVVLLYSTVALYNPTSVGIVIGTLATPLLTGAVYVDPLTLIVIVPVLTIKPLISTTVTDTLVLVLTTPVTLLTIITTGA